MKVIAFTLFLVVGLSSKSQTLTFTVNSASSIFSITCANSQVTLVASSNYSSPVNYAWTGTNFSSAGATVMVSNAGNYVVIGSSGTISSTQTITISTDTVAPVCFASSTFQISNATVAAQPFIFTAISPTVNLMHYSYSPYAPLPVVSSGISAIFGAGISGPGTYTHCIINIINGCSTCIPFVISSGPIVGTTTVSIGQNNPDNYSDEVPAVFPNPSNGIFKIDCKCISIRSTEVYNNLGALIYAEDWSDNRRFINIQHEPPGVYFVKILDGSGRHSFLKIIRE